jgi:hypothetical protein
MGQPISHIENEEDVDQEHLADLRRFIRNTYAVGILVWTLAWLLMLHFSLLYNHPVLWTGYAFGLLFLTLNGWISTRDETIGSYAAEKSEMDRLERNAFYTVAALFAMGSLMASIQTNVAVIATVFPFLIMVIFLVICTTMAPLWLSTVDAIQTIRHKHIKTVLICYGMGFMVTALCILFVAMARKITHTHSFYDKQECTDCK